MDKDDSGKWVTYADHVAALAEAEQRVRMERLRDTGNGIKAIGHYEGLREAREAVAGLHRVDRSEQYGDEISRDDALAAIDAMRGAE
jgi:hypothetical protein